MKNQMWSGLTVAAFVAFGVALSAERQAPAAQRSAHPQSVKVIGCVERPTSAIAGAPTPSAATSDAMFMLAKAVVAPATPTSATAERPVAPAVGTSGGSSPNPKMAATYRLEATASLIAPHVGHKVEVSGEVVETLPPATGGPTPSASGQAETPSAAGAVAAREANAAAPLAQRLRVSEIKMLAETCS